MQDVAGDDVAIHKEAIDWVNECAEGARSALMEWNGDLCSLCVNCGAQYRIPPSYKQEGERHR